MRAPMIELRAEGAAIEGDTDDVDDRRDVGESKGGESVFSRLCATFKGVRVLTLEMVGRRVSVRVLGDCPRG